MAEPPPSDPKADLHRYLQVAREALLWKLEGTSEYDARRPLTPTGTNLLGLVKHVATVASEYFGSVFGRPSADSLSWADEGAEHNADMWATAEESRQEIIDLFQRVWEHADATIDSLPLEAPGRVPWWGDRGQVTLHRILVHVTAEVSRHAGHADIVREMIDGSVGFRKGNDNLPPVDEAWWADYRNRLEEVARRVSIGPD
ncbi:MAG TPA: DinB family protein [Acidimicrobiia bacterium]|nr:DinB family protein [Acidimicrobiia bacterium]